MLDTFAPTDLLELWRQSGPVALTALGFALAAMIAAMPSPKIAGAMALTVQAVLTAGALDLGFAALLSGEAVDRPGGFVAMLGAGLSFVAVLSAGPTLRADDRPRAAPAALAAMVAMGACIQGAALLARTPWELFVWLEAASLTAVTLASLTGRLDGAATRTCLIALAGVGVGGALLAFGLAIPGGGYAAAFAAAFVSTGIALRCGVAPVHGPFMALTRSGLAGAMLAGPGLALVALILLPRWLASVEIDALRAGLQIGFAGIGAIGCLIAALQASAARDLRQFIAAALSVQCAVIFVGMATLSHNGVAAALTHSVTLVTIAIGLLAAAAIAAPHPSGLIPLACLDGLSTRRPLAAAAMAGAALSVVGAPLTAGFLSKWLLIQAALAQGWPLAAAAIVLASLITVAPAGALIERMYFTPADETAPAPLLSGVALAPALAIAFIATFALGLNAADLIAWAQFAGPEAGGK